MGLEDTAKLRDWDKRLLEQYSRGWDNYLRRRIYLDTARDLDCWGICGEFFYVEALSSAIAIGSIRLNRNTNDPIALDLGTIVKTIFCNIYITHAALQGEWIDIIYGINFEYYKSQPIQVAAAPPPVGGALAALQLPNGHDVTVDNAGAGAAVNIQDGGNSITIDDGGVALDVNAIFPPTITVDDGGGSLTVDGTFFQATQPVSAAALPLPAGAATAALQLADGHNVTVDNAAGGAAVNIQDGGNSITVDGTFFQATQPVSAAALPLPAGAATAALQLADGHNVTVQEPLSVDDNGASLTVDGVVTVVDNGIAQNCITITNAAADDNVAGANHACKRVLVRAHTINTGLVWVDFGTAAVALGCYPLDKGDSVGVPLTNTNLVNCLFKVANEKVTVVYTN